MWIIRGLQWLCGGKISQSRVFSPSPVANASHTPLLLPGARMKFHRRTLLSRHTVPTSGPLGVSTNESMSQKQMAGTLVGSHSASALSSVANNFCSSIPSIWGVRERALIVFRIAASNNSNSKQQQYDFFLPSGIALCVISSFAVGEESNILVFDPFVIIFYDSTIVLVDVPRDRDGTVAD
jgi:hypothetical protein